MATAVRWSNTDSIALCGMSRATPEATGCCYQATACSVLPQQLPGQYQTKQQQQKWPALLAISMAAAVRRYNTARIAQWRRSRALVEATGRRQKNNIWTSGFCITYVSLNAVLKTHHWTSIKPVVLLLFTSFCPTLACAIPAPCSFWWWGTVAMSCVLGLFRRKFGRGRPHWHL